MTQKLATCIAHRYTYVHRLLANTVAVHYGSYRRANKYLYTVVDQPFDMFDLHAFPSNQFIPILYLFVHPPFLRIFGNLCPLTIRTAKLKFFYFVRIITNSPVCHNGVNDRSKTIILINP